MTEDFQRSENKGTGLVTKCVVAAAIAAGGIAYMNSKNKALKPTVPNAQFFTFNGEYDNSKPSDAIPSNSDCSNAELQYIDAGIQSALGPLQWSLANENEFLFKKWFGESHSQSDNDVRQILSDATHWMDQRGNLWNPLCCKSSIGACGTCQSGSGTQAFVTSWWYTNDPSYQFNVTWVRICEAMMNSSAHEVGFIMFHELVHVVSQVGDSSLGYGKGPLVGLAASNPEAARASANNYMLYAAQNGLNYEQYNELSGGWGANAFDPNCVDQYSNCGDIASNCCGNTDKSSYCCASCMVYDATATCLDKNYPYRPGHGLVFDPNEPGLGLQNNVNPPPTPSPPTPEQCTEADGSFGCGMECESACDCYTGMECRAGQCVDESTQSANFGSACDAWEVEHGSQIEDGSLTCGESCGASSDCHANLFCCPNWSLCMDTSTYSTQGPNCSDNNVDPTPAPAVNDCIGTQFCEIGQFAECSGARSTTLQRSNATSSQCYELCLEQGNCHYFLRDPSDGECRGYTNLGAGECASPYSNSPYYMLFQINFEPETQGGHGPGNDGVALLLGERKWCNASYSGLPYSTTGAQGCADACNNIAGCEFFHHDQSDGQCLQSNTDAPNCPEGLMNSTYYNFYSANGGAY